MLVAATFVAPAILRGQETVLHSGPQRVHLLELYTSEGCSSCPPAEEAFSRFRDDSRLWREIVPVAFHVDYWDRLGWTDRLASSAYTDRQQRYAQEWGSNSFYTPEFVLDGREYPSGVRVPNSAQKGGLLTVKLAPSREMTIQYQPSSHETPGEWTIHAATLGIGVETKVKAGENGGRTLRHDFVVLSLATAPMTSGSPGTTLNLPPARPGEKALAVWVTEAHHSTPLQAVGGWLK